ncbi:MAG: hypothetical protein KatS3mg034_2084 [Vicingaceae bacterium]|nr:MAG: hypothetical protein KatS3mg034_2084 [Vicingaceae bacterium]
MPTLLSIISDHNIPNLRVAKHFWRNKLINKKSLTSQNKNSVVMSESGTCDDKLTKPVQIKTITTQTHILFDRKLNIFLTLFSQY